MRHLIKELVKTAPRPTVDGGLKESGFSRVSLQKFAARDGRWLPVGLDTPLERQGGQLTPWVASCLLNRAFSVPLSRP